MIFAGLLFLAVGVFLLWHFIFKKNKYPTEVFLLPSRIKAISKSENATRSYEPREEAKIALGVTAHSARFDFVASPANPKMSLAFRLDNQSRHEMLVEKIVWAVTVEPKSVPSVRGELIRSVLLPPKTVQDQLIAQALVNHAEAAYVSQLRRGLTLRCLAEGMIIGHVKGTVFEKPFSCFDIPCMIEEERGPFFNTHIDPTHIDPLTGLLNRKFLTDNLNTIVDTTSHKPMSFVMLDIDDFKSINDHYGHLIGDDAIKAVCAKIRESVGDKGFSLRYGGDEFSALLKGVDTIEAGLLAEKIRSSVSEYHFQAKGDHIQLTVSVGVATMRYPADFMDLMQRADDMLRASKQQGKNRVTEWAA